MFNIRKIWLSKILWT